MPQIAVCEVKVGVLSHGNATVTKNAAERVDVHAVHQAALGEIIPQCMRGVGFVNSCPSQITLER